MKRCLGIVTVLLAAGTALAADWMLHPEGFVGEVKAEGERITLTNGLVTRVFDRGTTVGLSLPQQGENILRSIRPEGQVTIDEAQIPIGGMKGQPIHNYLLPEWLEKMTHDPAALPYVGHEVGAIRKRFDWKRRTEWMSVQPDWPAKGKELTLKFRATPEFLKALERAWSTEANRTLLWNDAFAQKPEGWKTVVSAGNPSNAFENEGKMGEILVPAESSAYAERALPEEATIVETVVFAGTDKGAEHGIGMAVDFGNHTFRFAVDAQRKKAVVTMRGDTKEWVGQAVDLGKPITLRFEREEQAWVAKSLQAGQTWQVAATLPMEASAEAKTIRLGKMGREGVATVAAQAGEPGRSRVERVLVRGTLGGDRKATLAKLEGLEVDVHYEVYDGMPLLCKWLEVRNGGDAPFTVQRYVSEWLAAFEPENAAIHNRSFMTPNITVETDFTHCMEQLRDQPHFNQGTRRHAQWVRDPLYGTQTDWLCNIPCLLESTPQYGPDVDLAAGETLESHRTWELFHDSWDRERKTLQVRQMMRKLAPWTAENPIFMHVRSAADAAVKKAIDQCAEVGFEMVIMTFWSGVNMEDESEGNLKRMKALADYAHAKGIALGGYSLLASRSINAENDVVMPPGERPMFGASPCLESKWGQDYMRKLKKYFEATGQDILEHDGSYPGDECASTKHPGHKGLQDSQWKQYKTIANFYKWCRANGIFLNIPDWYMLNGAHKTGMGYRENNWSLPRHQQEVIERQNIYDGTWLKTPAMGWMFVPLTEYHGGGAAATIEPLHKHLDHYGMRLANNFGAGVIACYRGPQLYDTPETKAVVKTWIDFYKKHRAILDSDVIHLRRPDGMDWDGLLHVNHSLPEKGLLMLYNPLNTPITKTLTVPVYYTGLHEKATIRHRDAETTTTLPIARDYTIQLPVTIPARSCTWYTLQ